MTGPTSEPGPKSERGRKLEARDKETNKEKPGNDLDLDWERGLAHAWSDEGAARTS